MITPAGTSKRLALAAGAVGLAGGLALGVTGLASAVSPSPNPDARQQPAGPGQRPHGPGRMGERPGGGGLVSAITASSLTVRTPRGTKTVALNDSTAFYDGQDKTTRSAVHVGDRVRVRVADPRATTPVAATVVVLPAHLAGWVTAKDGDLLTITDPDGFTRTIRTSSATKVVKDGADSALSAVTVGSFVRATGKVAPDGTTLNADRVALGEPKRGPRDPSASGPGQAPAGDEVSPQA